MRVGCWGVTEQKTRFRTHGVVRNNDFFRGLLSCEGEQSLAKLRTFANLSRRTDLQAFSFPKVFRKIHYFCEVFFRIAGFGFHKSVKRPSSPDIGSAETSRQRKFTSRSTRAT